MAATAAQAAGPGQAVPAPSSRPNLIFLVLDTWGANWFGCYGNANIRTPHVDALAARSAKFTSAYPENLPTIPARRTLYTGRRTFPSIRIAQPGDPVALRGWHQLYAEDETLAETLKAAGYTTALISDVYHQFKPGKNFHRGFDVWRWIRGQETDRFETGPLSSIPLVNHLHSTQVRATIGWTPKARIAQYLLNRRDWKSEEDWCPAQVFSQAALWLEKNANLGTPLYLHVESFAPHEFWDPPEPYYREYMKTNYGGPRLIFSPRNGDQMTAAEIAHVKAMYAGYVTFVDACIGKFLKKVESLGLMQNSIIVFLGDHGTLVGEQNQFHKGENRLRIQVTRVPLLMYHPAKQWAGRTIDRFVQHTDMAPTLLEMLGEKPTARMTGESFISSIENGGAQPESIIIGWGEHASLRTPEWNYIGQWRGGDFEELYDLKRDPDELRNVAAEHPKLAAEFRRKILAHVDGGWPVTKGTFAAVVES